MKILICLLTLLGIPAAALASGGAATGGDFTHTIWGYLGIILFVGAYSLVPFENTIMLNMGQLLSIPFVLLGLFMVWRSRSKEAT